MLYSLTAGQKNLVDTILAAVGAGAGWVIANGSLFPSHYQSLVAIIGGTVGYFASDAITYVNTGTISQTQIQQQISTLVNSPAVQAKIQAEIAKLPAADQPVAQAIVKEILAQITGTSA